MVVRQALFLYILRAVAGVAIFFSNLLGMMKRILSFLFFLSLAGASGAQSRSAVETSTDILMFLPSATGGVASLAKGDYKGLLQHLEAGAATVVTTYLLKYTIDKRRPDGSDNHSFPSNHTGIAFIGASFLQQRYGWKWGAPAYAVAAYVGWGRIFCKQHDFWDVLAGAAIGTTSAIVLTTPYAREHNISFAPFALPNGGCGVHFSMNL